MEDQFDYFDAPQYFDFVNDVVPDDIDKYFDADYAAYKQQSHQRRASSLPPRSVKNVQAQQFSPAVSEEEDKENSGPTPERHHRSSSLPPEKNNAARVLADISCTSTLSMTPSRASRKSQITFLNNGRSVRVQKYEGIRLITPNKTHPMETRMDLVINSPGLNLRSRSVTKSISRISRIDTITESKTEMQDAANDEDSPMQCTEDTVEKPAAIAECEAEPAQPASKGRSVVILPTQQKAQAPVVEAAPKPESKPKRIQHTAPMVAQFRPVRPTVSAAAPDASKAKADKGVFRTTAELVRNFHRATPDRFHSVPANQKPQLRRPPSPSGPRPNTIPKSPFMTLKSRVRVENIPSHADKEKAELEEMKKHQIKARPVPRQVLVPPVQKNIVVAKIQATKPSPFKLTQMKRKEATPEPVFRFKANPVPRRILQSPQGVPPRQEIPLTEPHTPALIISSKYPKKPKIDGIDLNVMGHVGVVRQVTPGRLTQVQPFSFEERNRELQSKRMELVQKQLECEKRAREFHAGKLPNFDRAPLLPEKKLMPVTVPHTPKLSTFTLGARNQQKFYEKLAEEEQKMQEAVIFKAKPVTVTHVEPFKPVLPHRVITDTTLIPELVLNTEKRAVDRAKFDELLRVQEKYKEESRLALEKLKEEDARLEEMKMRKEAEFHANPVRKCTPMKIKPSDKPLTDSHTPNFTTYERLGRPKQ